MAIYTTTPSRNSSTRISHHHEQARNNIKRALLVVLLILTGMSAGAVLPENNVDKTVMLLQNELSQMNDRLDNERRHKEASRSKLWAKIADLEEQISVARLVLLSQDANNPLGMAKATQNAHELLNNIGNFQEPIEGWMDNLRDKIARTKGIRAELHNIDTLRLSDNGRRSRTQALTLCDSLETFYADYLERISTDVDRYHTFKEKVVTLSETNHSTLDKLYQSIFVVGNQSFLDIIKEYSYLEYTYSTDSFDEKNSDNADSEWLTTPEVINKIDDWSTLARLILVLLIYVSISYFLRGDKTSRLYRHRGALSLITFFVLDLVVDTFMLIFIAAPVHVSRSIVIDMEFDVLVTLIIATKILRSDRQKLLNVLLAYAPMLIATFIIMNVINDITPIYGLVLILTVILISFGIFQLIANILLRKKLSRRDKTMSWANLTVMAGCLAATWAGWAILAIMGLLLYVSLWTLQLIYAVCKKLIRSRANLREKPIARYTIISLINPLLVIAALIGSTFWVAGIFNIDIWLTRMLATPFVNIPEVCIISVENLLLVIVIGVIVNYCVGLAKRVFLTRGSDRYALGKKAVMISLCSIIAWLAYSIAVIVLLHINHTGIIAAIGGASLGLGFALRDTIENFFYGLTMMTGRARPGDIVECDDIRGIVRQVGIISTSVETEDGPIVSMPNRQLFGRNFKNLTVNNSQELRHITIEIDASNDIDKARRLMLESVKGIDGVIDEGSHYVIMRHCGNGIVKMELKVWIDTRKYLRAEPAVREAIFHAFAQNGIKDAHELYNIELHNSNRPAQQ